MFVLFLILYMSMLQTCHGVCCPLAYVNYYWSAHGYYCADGTEMYKGFVNVDRFCGYGKCNAFGCNCDGGCRQWISDPTTFTMYGVQCLGECKPHFVRELTYYWCDTRDGWDYCSPKPYVDIHGLKCKDSCGPKWHRYSWCRREIGGWEYCGAQFNHAHTFKLNYLLLFVMSVIIFSNYFN